jgi:hypothetical protein
MGAGCYRVRALDAHGMIDLADLLGSAAIGHHDGRLVAFRIRQQGENILRRGSIIEACHEPRAH